MGYLVAETCHIDLMGPHKGSQVQFPLEDCLHQQPLVGLGEVGYLLHMMVPDHTGDTRELLIVRRDDTKGLVILEQAATHLVA